MKGIAIGAVSIHLILFAFVWLKGAVLGTAEDPSEIASGWEGEAVEYGWAGGMQSANEMLVLYVFTFGAVPLFLSIFGAIVGFGLGTLMTWGPSNDSTEATEATSVPNGFVLKVLAWSAASYIAVFVTYGVIPGGISLFGSPGPVFSLLQFLNVAIWVTSAIAAYLRTRCWQIPAGIIGVGVAITLLAMFQLLPLFGLLLAAILLLVYVTATKKRTSSVEAVASPMQEIKIINPQTMNENGAGGVAVFILGGFSYYALVCLFTFSLVMNNRNSDNWGIFMPVVVGVWGIPIFGTVAAIIHTWTGPWAWLSKQRARLYAGLVLLACVMFWIVLLQL